MSFCEVEQTRSFKPTKTKPQKLLKRCSMEWTKFPYTFFLHKAIRNASILTSKTYEIQRVLSYEKSLKMIFCLSKKGLWMLDFQFLAFPVKGNSSIRKNNFYLNFWNKICDNVHLPEKIKVLPVLFLW